MFERMSWHPRRDKQFTPVPVDSSNAIRQPCLWRQLGSYTIQVINCEGHGSVRLRIMVFHSAFFACNVILALVTWLMSASPINWL